jgi:hypothetical protein
MTERLIETADRHDFVSADLFLISEEVKSMLCYRLMEFQAGIRPIRSRRCCYSAFNHFPFIVDIIWCSLPRDDYRPS